MSRGICTQLSVTSISRWLNSNQSWLATGLAYDIAGNVVWISDPKNNFTSFSYNDNFPDGSRNTYALLTKVANPLNQLPFQAQYDYNTGKPTITADLRGQYTTY